MLRFVLYCFLFFSSFLGKICAYELGVISMFRNEALILNEWIDYHIMMGVDHFWLYNDGSKDDSLEVLSPYIQQGIVEVIEVEQEEPSWISRQVCSFADGLRRAKGLAKWVAIIDQDEFLVPMKEGTITDCLNKHFSETSAVYVNWRNFGTGGVTLRPGQSILANLVACSLQSHPRNAVGKSIVRPEHVDIDNMWNPHFCLPYKGMFYLNGDRTNTFKLVGSNLITDGKNHSKYIGIHHYAFRDQKYFKEVRLPRETDLSSEEIMQMEDAFNLVKNYKILEVIKYHHPDLYKEKWMGPYDKKIK